MKRRVDPTILRRHTLAGLALVLSGCILGPDFERPAAPAGAGYTAGEVSLPEAGPELQQRILVGQRIARDWWNAFGSPQIDDAVRLALADSPTVEASRATLAQALASLSVARASLAPALDIDANASRETTRSDISSGSRSFFSVGPAVTYGPDLFGRVRRLVEQQSALAEFQQHELRAAYLSVSGNIVSQALTIASLREQIRVIEDILAADRSNIELVEISLEAGKSARSDLLSARSQLAADETLLPPLRRQLAAARHALAILAGRSPAEWPVPDFDLGTLALPTEIPLSVPAALVRTRPDILAAESQLRAANAAVGIATANLYPSLTLSADWTRQTSGGLFNDSVTVSSIGAGLTAPIFHASALQAQREAARAAYAAALASYRQTVLISFGQVADALRALEHDATLLAAQYNALSTAEASLALLRESYAAGRANLLQVLDAQRQVEQARLGYARARGQRFLDTAQLFAAMGGGWGESETP